MKSRNVPRHMVRTNAQTRRHAVGWVLRVLLATLSSFTAFEAVRAEPCTLYKAGDVANARENIKRYPWAQRIVARWERRVGYLMEQDRRFVDDMISELTPWSTYGQNCPVCVNKKSSMGECNLYRWDVAEPDKLTCKYCGTVYPNPKYPETGELVCPRMGQTFTYYETEAERARPEDKSGTHAFRWVRWPVHTSFSGLIRTYKAGYLVDRVLPLATEITRLTLAPLTRSEQTTLQRLLRKIG